MNILETFEEKQQTGRIFFEVDYTDGNTLTETESLIDTLADSDAFLNTCEEEYTVRFSNLTYLSDRLARAQEAKLCIALYEESKHAIFRFDSNGMALGGKHLPLLAQICTLSHGMVMTATDAPDCPHRMEFSFLLCEDKESIWHTLFQKQ